MAKKKKQFNKGLTIFLAIVLFLLGIAGGFVGYHYLFMPSDSDKVVSGDLEIHFLELGNKYTGDCTYIKAGDTDILIDAGSKTSSIPTISEYLDAYVDQYLEYYGKSEDDYTAEEFEQMKAERAEEIFSYYDDAHFTERAYYNFAAETLIKWPTVKTLDDRRAYPFDSVK